MKQSYIHILLALALLALSSVPASMWAQNDAALLNGEGEDDVIDYLVTDLDEVKPAIIEDSIISYRDYHKLRRAERDSRATLPRVRRRQFGSFAVRTNLLRWATFTPELTLACHYSVHWEPSVSFAYTSASWQKMGRRYAFWKVEPEFRRYWGEYSRPRQAAFQRWYWAIHCSLGQSHYKFSDNGREGWVWGAGLGLGYQWRMSQYTSLDFHLGAGYNGAYLDRYDLVPYFVGQEPQRTYRDSKHYDYWGLNQLGINLVWELHSRKGRRR